MIAVVTLKFTPPPPNKPAGDNRSKFVCRVIHTFFFAVA
jgi:hypothetical protein